MVKKLNFARIFLPALLVAIVVVVSPTYSFADASLLAKADKQILVKKYKAAVRTLTNAMNSGDLSDKQMAQALHKRGTAYNGSGRHSSAVADLTGALWLGKLSVSAKKDAFHQRAIAYQSTGHKKLARSDFSRAGQNTASSRSETKRPDNVLPAAPIPSFSTVVSPVKKTRPAPSTHVAAKPVIPSKPVIPDFRTSIATE